MTNISAAFLFFTFFPKFIFFLPFDEPIFNNSFLFLFFEDKLFKLGVLLLQKYYHIQNEFHRRIYGNWYYKNQKEQKQPFADVPQDRCSKKISQIL